MEFSGIIVATMDANTAFDATSHNTLATTDAQTHAPTKVQLATARDYHNKLATPTLPNAGASQAAPFEQGGWHGGANTPAEYNRIIEYII